MIRPKDAKTHTAQFIGNDRVIFVQNGNPAKSDCDEHPQQCN